MFLFVLASLIWACKTSNPIKQTIEQEKPKLVVGIVVDQMRMEYLHRYARHYGERGFKRLLKKGYNCRNTHYNYIPTSTGPGHASVYTGTTPAAHGIIANYWYDKNKGDYQYCVSDSNMQTVGSNSTSGERSPHMLLSTTITDELVLASNYKSKVVGISLKDRGAILPAGHKPTGAYWFDASTGSFISSTWYHKELPTWLQAFNAEKRTEQYLSKPWETLKPIAEYTESEADDNRYEGLHVGEEKPVFPHPLPDLIQQNGLGLVGLTPFGNTLIVDMAEAAIDGERLGQGEQTDFLALSFSSTDKIGHRYGPRSIEVQDTYLRLDLEMERLIDLLDDKVGKGEYLIFLTADHGSNESLAHLEDLRFPGKLFKKDSLITWLGDRLNKSLGEGEWVKSVSNNQVFLNWELAKQQQLYKADLLLQVADMLLQYEGISTALPSLVLEHDLQQENLLTRGYHPLRSGDVLFKLLPGWMDYEDWGTSHGSGYTYDTHVPLIWYGTGIAAGSDVNYTSITQIAPTVSFLLGIPLPTGADPYPVPALFQTR